MGSACSKSGAHSGGHTVLGSAASNEHHSRGQGAAMNPSSSGSASARIAAAEAAERRLKEAQARGTNAANPKRGRLASQAEAAKSNKGAVPQADQEERLVWD